MEDITARGLLGDNYKNGEKSACSLTLVNIKYKFACGNLIFLHKMYQLLHAIL